MTAILAGPILALPAAYWGWRGDFLAIGVLCLPLGLLAVRSLSHARLESTTDAELERPVTDAHFGQLTARDVWVGVATSCAWHGGQIVMPANRFVPR